MNGPHDKKLIQIRPLFFSNNTSTDTKEEIKILLGVSEIKEYERFLDLPTVVGRKKKDELEFHKR